VTTQEVYELMRVYLTRPGARQATRDGLCRYEALKDGEIHRCAIGCLLGPDTLSQVRFYDNGGQCRGDYELRVFPGSLEALFEASFELPELDGADYEFLASAQTLHDNGENWLGGHFHVRALDELARRYGLRIVSDEDPEGVTRSPSFVDAGAV
jgi:hypothetical protein